MCPAPCFLRYHTLQEYLFDDPDRNNSAKKTQRCAWQTNGWTRQTSTEEVKISIYGSFHPQQSYVYVIKMVD